METAKIAIVNGSNLNRFPWGQRARITESMSAVLMTWNCVGKKWIMIGLIDHSVKNHIIINASLYDQDGCTGAVCDSGHGEIIIQIPIVCRRENECRL
jgi:hypothetical protein